METCNEEQRVAAIKARLADMWQGSHGYFSDDYFPTYNTAGAEVFGRFVGAVVNRFDISNFMPMHIEHFDSANTLAWWIVQEQDRKSRLKAEGEDTDEDD